MSEDFIKLNRLVEDELISLISKYSILSEKEIPSEYTILLKEYIKEKGIKNSTESLELRTSYPEPDPNSFALMIPRTYYYINVKKTTLNLAVAALDIFYTKGLISASMAPFGVLGKSIAKLNPQNGEFCLYSEAMLLRKQKIKHFEEFEIINKLKNMSCDKRRLNCIFNKNETCSIEIDNVKEIFQSLEKKSIFSKTKVNNWKVNP